ncbi:putative ATPase subunit 9 [Leptomonas seymouri]|uniref:Putative ATPase subunit 9 n=1 Tax=Leptomonas seymouri TaxID=5684 RepID=A0A0N0P410_LEPSE|nr:putative ATPase subunit 9 [Leptomonas seymouri]|eukprot:KPI84277.1 putative ATPase subunit 9 [Leptomonas seymouri]
MLFGVSCCCSFFVEPHSDILLFHFLFVNISSCRVRRGVPRSKLAFSDLRKVPTDNSPDTMGSSAKITRGGNKKRVNQGRLEAKLRAQGAKSHTTSVKESVEAKKLLKQRAQAIAGELKAKAQAGGSTGNASPPHARSASSVGIVRMAPKPAAKPKPSTQSEE